MAISCDVLVVGAGPAGCSAAYFLKHYDKDNSINVNLVDRLGSEKYKQYHDMCGEAVSESLFSELLPLKPEGIAEKIKLIREYWPGNIEINTPVKGCIINRAQFLESIIDEFIKKGGYYENKPVETVTQKENKVNVKFEDKSKAYDYVIAADGANSIIRKKLKLDGRTKTLIQYVIDNEPEDGVIKFYYDERYSGDYMWEFPHEGNTKIGYPLIKGNVLKPDGKIISKQARTVGYGGLTRYIDEKILLIGDAACQTNPMTKGGIRAGMIAGKLAAKAVADRNPKLYEKEWIKQGFSSSIFLKSFEKLRDMNNMELEKHMKPFKDASIGSPYLRMILNLKLALFYSKYIGLYRAYDLCNKFGW